MNLIEATKKIFGLGEPTKKHPDSIWKRKTCKSCEYCEEIGCAVKFIHINRTQKACSQWTSKK